MANEFEELSEGGLVVVSCLSVSQFEVNLGEVHANCLWDESLKEFESEIKTDSISLSGTCALESSAINAIDIEGDPVFAIGLMAEVLVNDFVHALKSFKFAVLWLEDECLLFSEESFFLLFI